MVVSSPRSSARPRNDVPVDYPDEKEHRRLIAEGVRELFDGKIRAIGTVTLTANDTTTTLADLRIGPDSVIVLMPTTANAAGGLGTTYISARGKQTATLTHANASTTDRTFAYAILG
jgi:hypothetical protein